MHIEKFLLICMSMGIFSFSFVKVSFSLTFFHKFIAMNFGTVDVSTCALQRKRLNDFPGMDNAANKNELHPFSPLEPPSANI